MSAPVSRRRLLQAALVVPAAAACTSYDTRPARIDPDVALRADAVARERLLIARYDAAVPTPAVASIRAEHEQHLAALGARLPSASPAPSGPAAPAVPVAALVSAERAAAAEHVAAALQASPALAAVLASLAASEASHPVALS